MRWGILLYNGDDDWGVCPISRVDLKFGRGALCFIRTLVGLARALYVHWVKNIYVHIKYS